MRCLIATLIITMALSTSAFAQGIGSGLFELPGKVAAAPLNVEVTSALGPTDQPGVVTLYIKMVMPPGTNTYSMDPSLPKPTKITVKLPAGWTALDQKWASDPAPKKSFDEAFQQDLEKFYDTVVFSQRFQLAPGTNPNTARLTGDIKYLLCNKDSCMPKSADFDAAFAAPGSKKYEELNVKKKVTDELSEAAPKISPSTARPVVDAAPEEIPASVGYVITPKRKSKGGEVADPVQLQFELTPADAKAGEIVTLAITMTLKDHWSTYGLTKADETQNETPTSIKLELSNLVEVGAMTAVPPPELHTTKVLDEVSRSNAHERRVTWRQKFNVIDQASYGLSGEIRYQICEIGQTCLRPLAIPFSLGDQQQAQHVADASPVLQSFAKIQTSDTPAETSNQAFTVEESGKDLTFAGALLGAFFAGLIMNVMPCVLPVLAIKILSFVQQAGQSRGRIIGLNLSYTAGVMLVFFVFAILSWGLGNSLSSMFQNEPFMIFMSCVVFLMGLSLFGVFELPVPGIIPSAGHHHEGYLGAFNTGIIATILGTPCLAPFVAPTFAWCLTQPTPVVFSVFGMMGLGMASPFLLTGIFPSLVNALPRPGNWMVQFKQFTGFVLMGTVIFLLASVRIIPVLILLLSLSLLVWMSANLAAPHDPAGKRWRAFGASFATSAPIFLFGLWMLITPAAKMPWNEFSESQLVKLRLEGRPMLIDFTADWCAICKINEAIALDRAETVKFVKENGFVPMMADFTKENPEILKWLREFGQDSVPLTIIVPPGKGSDIIALRGQYTQSILMSKLQQAMKASALANPLPSVEEETPAVSAALPVLTK